MRRKQRYLAAVGGGNLTGTRRQARIKAAAAAWEATQTRRAGKVGALRGLLRKVSRIFKREAV